MAKPDIDWDPKIKNDKTAIMVVSAVFILLVKVWIKLRLIISANLSKELTFFSIRIFSRIRSKTTIVLLIEYPMIVKIADRKSTRLNSSHVAISYAVFCLKK